MYRGIYYEEKTNLIHLWGDGQHDDEGYQQIEYEPYAYVVDSRGEHITIDGLRCKKVDSWSEEAVNMGMVYEHNVKPTTRFLIDKYTDSDDVANNTKVLYLDIEIAKEERYSTPQEANNTITAITHYATGAKNYVCYLLDTEREPGYHTTSIEIDLKDDAGNVIGKKPIDAIIYTFQTERKLLRKWIMDYQKVDHNVITGWNAEFFDMPYLFNRMVKVLGYGLADMLSPAKIVKKRFTRFGESLQIAGVTVLDYMMLYKKFTYTEQSNYRLDTIAKVELNRGKVEYDGDLEHLYKTDIIKFAEYNIIDVELPVALEEKMGLIMTALGICHAGHCAHNDIQFTSMYLDGAALTYCKRNNLIASANRSVSDEQAQGAFVKKPIPGLYKWIYDLDLTSLYPMNMITLNISPETKYSKIIDWDEDAFVKGTDTVYNLILYKDESPPGQFEEVFSLNTIERTLQIQGSDALKDYVAANNLSIASNGCMYDMTKMGIIPSILSMWFDDRKRFKDLRKKYEKEGDHAQAVFFDRKQLITKIMLNSFYGVLLLPSFRFYDKDNGEAVTLTGQSVIHHATRAADYFYNKELAEYNCVYEIETSDGTIKEYNGFDEVETARGKKFVYMLTEQDEII